MVLDGVQRCLEALRSNPSASVAQGYSFSFLGRQDGGMDLGNILYFTPTIDDATPLARLAKLFARYQAATYGNYRTPVLQRDLRHAQADAGAFSPANCWGPRSRRSKGT